MSHEQPLRVDNQQICGTELLTPAELAAANLPEGPSRIDIIREREHLFTHLADATNPDGAIALPHVQALRGATVTVHNHPYKIERFLGHGFTGLALESSRPDRAEPVAVKLSRPYDHELLNAKTFANEAEADAVMMARGMMNEISSLHRLTRGADGQPLQRHGGEPPFPILIEAELLSDPTVTTPAAQTDRRIAAVVLERIQGTSLSKIVHRERHLRDQLPRLKKISLGLARAVRLMHEAGVLHLDLKSSNVVVTEDNDPIVLDFGSSQQPSKWAGTSTGKPIRWAEPLSERTHTKRYTTRQDQAGTPREANDIYSLGITLRDLIYGIDDSIDQTEIKRQLTPELLMLDKIIQQMTRPDPEQRPDARYVEQQLTNSWQAMEDSAAQAAVRQEIAS